MVGWWNVLRIQMGDHWPPPADAVTSSQAESVTEAFAARSNPRRDDIAIDYAPSTASDIQLYDGGTEFFPAMLSDIEQARSSVHISIFAFAPGVWGDRFAAALIERAHAGVEVRLTVDRHGSSVTGDSEAMLDEMAAAGIEIAVNDVFPIQASGTLPDRHRTWSQDEVGQVDHRKLLVIDGQIGWVGGAGFEDHFFTDEYHDVFVRVEGDIVRQLQAVFLTGFRAYGGTLPAGSGALAHFFPEPDDPGDIRITVLQNVPGGFRPATQATWALMDSAQERIEILNPYLSDHPTLERIEDAAKRGVDVTVVIPAESNNPPADAATAHRIPGLLDDGVDLYEYPRIIHAKVLVADDAVIVGSLNYDAWALYRNVELSLLIEDADVADRVVQTFVEPALAQSAPAEVHTGATDKIRDWFWDKLTYFL
ncbi:MAG TPA: phosphatidylserine/phosphatidylglycerophosphate/cardiolipin synthase family protein [Thermomicrobiales bacterium]|nr:phosphatidylserine/phosphatidylglycerophosphate/cardiolipin synthase family protein [Thermomicrobiales bacterium]